MNRGLAISVVLVGALIGAYFSVVVVGEWADEHRYIYISPLDYALDYLSDDIYKNIEIEVDWVSGEEPDWNAMNFLIDKIYEYCEKDRVYINHSASDIIFSYKNSYTLEDLVSMEKEHRNLYKHGDTAVIYFLYLNGRYADSSGYSEISTEVVGLTYSHSSVAIFKDQLRGMEKQGLSEERAEKSVLLHEFGHLICLVGIGYHADHEDPEHPHHTIHQDGVMYYAINASKGAPPPPLDFCEDSKKDIEFIKSRPRDESRVVYVPWLLLAADLVSALTLIWYIMRPEPYTPPQYPEYPYGYEAAYPYEESHEYAEQEDDYDDWYYY